MCRPLPLVLQQRALPPLPPLLPPLPLRSPRPSPCSQLTWGWWLLTWGQLSAPARGCHGGGVTGRG